MQADIIVGIPSYNESDSIGNVTKQVDRGLQKYFSGYKCIIVNGDSESEDNTKEAFLRTKTECQKVYINTGDKPRGKGNNLLHFYGLYVKWKARALATIDGDVTTVTPEWPKLLLEPILSKRASYVTPIYRRNRFEGNTTNHFAFPLLFGILGANVRQPVGGEYGLSRSLCEYLLRQRVVKTTRQYGIDIFTSIHAAGGEFDIAETFMGRKFHKPSFPKIVPMFPQTARSAFETISEYLGKQIRANVLQESSDKRSGIDPVRKPPSAKRKASLLKRMKSDFFARKDKAREYFGSLTDNVLYQIEQPIPKISADLWTDILATCISICAETDFSSGQATEMADCLTPVFLYRVASFARQIADISPDDVETIIQKQARLFQDKTQHIKANQ